MNVNLRWIYPSYGFRIISDGIIAGTMCYVLYRKRPTKSEQRLCSVAFITTTFSWNLSGPWTKLNYRGRHRNMIDGTIVLETLNVPISSAAPTSPDINILDDYERHVSAEESVPIPANSK
ncbi:hypothetical protein BDQ17DRAFT_1339148 [Cyathus striatus]|nr:hypothetical protein BDQ17DRAFT_1339148 [Cyathus striatus]